MEGAPVSSLADIAEYYSGKLAQHGESPSGVDWNSKDGQLLRFEQLCKVIDDRSRFSINDLGCGYGALHDFVKDRFREFSYCGIDICESMVRSAARRCQASADARFIHASEPDCPADYGVASGIFNVRLGHSKTEWWTYVEATLGVLDRTSRLGFSFNCLTSYSGADRMRDYLYYADPCALFNLCKRRFSRDVALLHDYGLYEFTILVRKAT